MSDRAPVVVERLLKRISQRDELFSEDKLDLKFTCGRRPDALADGIVMHLYSGEQT